MADFMHTPSQLLFVAYGRICVNIDNQAVIICEYRGAPSSCYD
jgi:hypothetical protein